MVEELHQELTLLFTVGTLLVQFYVGYLIILQTPKNMQDYKYFLILLLISDVLFTFTVGIVLQPYPLEYSAVQGKGLCCYYKEVLCVLSGSASLGFGAIVVTFQIYALLFRCLAIIPDRRLYNLYLSLPLKIASMMLALSIQTTIGYFFYAVNYRRDYVEMHPNVTL